MCVTGVLCVWLCVSVCLCDRCVCVTRLCVCVTGVCVYPMDCCVPVFFVLSMQESWSGLPFPTPGNPTTGESTQLCYIASGFFTTRGKILIIYRTLWIENPKDSTQSYETTLIQITEHKRSEWVPASDCSWLRSCWGLPGSHF